MDSNDEESTNNKIETDNSILPLISIYNKFYLCSKDSSGNIIKEKNKLIYICGKMFSHTLLAKYNFPACDFYLYSIIILIKSLSYYLKYICSIFNLFL